MSIDCAFHGFLAGDAESRTSAKSGKAWVRLRVGVGRGDDMQWVSVSVFGDAAVAVARELKKNDKVYIEGSIKLDTWQGNDGVERSGLSVSAWRVEHTHQIGHQRERKRDDKKSAATAPTSAPKTADEWNDTIPF
jgi:single-stranded DNA-binding protein